MTGAVCQAAGPYFSSRNAKVIVFIRAGQPFPPDTDGAKTNWTPLRQGSTLIEGQLVV